MATTSQKRGRGEQTPAPSTSADEGRIARRVSAGLDMESAGERFRALVQASPLAIIAFDREGRVTIWNTAATRIFGWTAPEVIGRPSPTILPAGREAFRTLYARVLEGETLTEVDAQRRCKDGTVIDVNLSAAPLHGPSGAVSGIMAVVADVSARKREHKALGWANRALKALFECSRALQRATDEPSLLNELCRIVVEVGGYRLAWVGFADHDLESSVRVAAYVGDDETYLRSIRISWADTKWGRGPVGRAIRTWKPSIVRDVATDPEFRPWRDEALRRGYAAAIALPLRVADEVLGAFTVYADEAGRFGSEEVELLSELAADLAYGLANLRTRTERQRAEEELRRNATRTALLAEASRALAEARLELDAVLGIVARLTAEAIGDGCVISLIGADGRRMEVVAAHHADAARVRLVRDLLQATPQMVDDGLSAEVLREGAPLRVWFASVPARAAAIEASYREYVDRYPVHGFLAVPLRVQGRAIGIVALWRDRSAQPYTAADEMLLQDLADRAALAIDNARLYEQIEQRVVERTHQLEAANRELEAFSYSVSHDLRAPLRAIDGFSRALREDYGERLDASGHHMLDRVCAASQRLGELIDDLLGLARVTRTEMQHAAVDLSGLVHALAAELQQAQPERRVTFVIADGLRARGDSRLLRVLLENLLGNAWKYSAKRAAARIEFGTRQEDGETVYYVRDDGVGFDMAYAAKLFQPFQRLHAPTEFEGSGIGLATAQRVVHRHGGRIWAEGSVHGGATFSFTLAP